MALLQSSWLSLESGAAVLIVLRVTLCFGVLRDY
jgi:hypothetical protein